MSPDAIRGNLARHWRDSARTGRRRRGAAWYPTAREWCEELAGETGLTVSQVVAILAVTSPGFQLATNLEHAAGICRGERSTGGRFPNQNRPKIEAVLASPVAAAEWARGPKVSPFHRAILGDTGALVLDRWALYAATGRRDSAGLDHYGSTRAREAIESAYRELARAVRLTVRDLQAVIWLQVRETTARAGDSSPRAFFDITT